MAAFSRQVVVDAVGRVVRPKGPVELHEPEFGRTEADYLRTCIEGGSVYCLGEEVKMGPGWVSYLGEFVRLFEKGLAKATGVKHAVLTVNGTVALHAALVVAGVQPGDEVLLPALTFAATANSVSHCYAIPHFVDSEFATLGLDPDKLATYLADKSELGDGLCRNRETGRVIRAVVPVHIFGHPVRMARLKEVAERFGLAIVEDAAEALGSRMNGHAVGGDGLLSVLSFNGNKVVTTGGGGAVLTNDDEIAARVKHLTTTARTRDPKRPWAFDHDEVGYNYRMPNINAAVGCAQLERLDDIIARKRRLAGTYAQALSGVPGISFFIEPPGAASNYWLNAILLEKDLVSERDGLLDEFWHRDPKRPIRCRPVWTPMHQLPMYTSCPRMDLSVCEDIAARLINLPSSPALASTM
jgi:perosamine synthetase